MKICLPEFLTNWISNFKAKPYDLNTFRDEHLQGQYLCIEGVDRLQFVSQLNDEVVLPLAEKIHKKYLKSKFINQIYSTSVLLCFLISTVLFPDSTDFISMTLKWICYLAGIILIVFGGKLHCMYDMYYLQLSYLAEEFDNFKEDRGVYKNQSPIDAMCLYKLRVTSILKRHYSALISVTIERIGVPCG